jgi:carbonic anhydrase
VGRWLDILRPGYERVKDMADADAQMNALEKQAVVISLENLMTFPFVAKAVSEGALTLHGLWHEIGSGALEQYSGNQDAFVPL